MSLWLVCSVCTLSLDTYSSLRARDLVHRLITVDVVLGLLILPASREQGRCCRIFRRIPRLTDVHQDCRGTRIPMRRDDRIFARDVDMWFEASVFTCIALIIVQACSPSHRFSCEWFYFDYLNTCFTFRMINYYISIISTSLLADCTPLIELASRCHPGRNPESGVALSLFSAIIAGTAWTIRSLRGSTLWFSSHHL